MAFELPPYPGYYNSNLSWIGYLPTNWNTIRTKYIFREIDDRTPVGTEILLSMRQNQGLVPHHEVSDKPVTSADLIGYKRTLTNDIVLNRMRASIGLVAKTEVSGIVSPDYAIFRPTKNINVDYFTLLFKTPIMGAKFRIESKGLGTGTAGFLRLYSDRFGAIAVPIPPRDEQDKIVSFISLKDKQISHFIGNRKNLINILSDKKLSIINQAVTCGTNPCLPFQPSSIPYLDRIPGHWKVRPLKHWVSINGKVIPETTDPETEIFYIDIGAVSTGFLVEQPAAMKFGIAPSRARRLLRFGDTIISTVRTYLKAIYFVNMDIPNLVASTGFAVLTPHPSLHPEFVSFVIQSSSFIERVTANSVGIAYPAITESRIGAFHIAIPPSKQEQAEIVELIKRKTASLDAAISQAQKEISLIREYRTRLFTDVLLGRVDIRSIVTSEWLDKNTVEESDIEKAFEGISPEFDDFDD